VKPLSADDSADTCAKVGNCQAPILTAPQIITSAGLLFVKWQVFYLQLDLFTFLSHGLDGGEDADPA
jgi:hypothetical protein